MSLLRNRIDIANSKLREENKKCLVIYITGGDPDIKTTLMLMHEIVEAGCDIIEIGVPFSDPMGDGVSNQKAAQRALKKGTNLKQIFMCIEDHRKKHNKSAIVLLSYLNPV